MTIYDRLSLLLFGVVLLLVFFTFGDYGISWDEPSQAKYGQLILKYYQSGLADFSYLNFSNLYLYGGIFDFLVALVNLFSPFGTFETRHLLNAMVGVIGLWGCWKISRFLAGPRAAFWSTLLLTLTPTYYGHMFNNPKDIPFAVAYIWSLYYLTRTIPLLPNIPWRLTIKLGIAIGCSLAVRVGGFFLLFYLALIVGGYLIFLLIQDRSVRRWWADLGITLCPRILLIMIIAFGIMLIFWPWVQLDPLPNLRQAFQEFSHFQWINPLVLFQGHIFSADQLPLYYLPLNFLIQLPEILFFLIAAALIAGLVNLKKTGVKIAAANWGLLALAILVPLAYVFWKRPLLYDCARQFIFLIMPLVVIAGAGMDYLFGIFPRTPAWARWVAAVLLGLYLGSQAGLMVRLHPYQYISYNSFTQGLTGAQKRYELDYWCHSNREAVRDLTEYLRRKMGSAFETTQFKISTCCDHNTMSYYFPPNFHWVSDPKQADFYIGVTRCYYPQKVPGELILEVSRLGVVINNVLDLRSQHRT